MKTKAVSNIPSSPPEEAEPWLLVPVAGSEPWPGGSCGTDGAPPWSRDGCCEVAEEGAVAPGRRCPRVAGRPTWSGTPESGSAGKADRVLAAADVRPRPESGTWGSRIAARPACGRGCRGVAGRAVAVGSKTTAGRGVALVEPLSPGMAVGVGGAASMDVGEASKELGASDAPSEAVPAETDGAVAGTDAVSLVISSVDGPPAPLAWPVETVSGGCGGRGVIGGIGGSPGGTVEADADRRLQRGRDIVDRAARRDRCGLRHRAVVTRAEDTDGDRDVAARAARKLSRRGRPGVTVPVPVPDPLRGRRGR